MIIIGQISTEIELLAEQEWHTNYAWFFLNYLRKEKQKLEKLMELE